MGQVRHGSATTTHAVRAAIQRSQASPPTLSREVGIEDGGEMAEAGDGREPEDWAEGPSLHDLDPSLGGIGRRIPPLHITGSRRLPIRVAAVDPAFDTVSAAPPPATARHIPSAGHWRKKPKRQRFKRYPIGFFRMDIAEVQTGEGKLYLFVGIERTSKFAVTQLVDKAGR